VAVSLEAKKLRRREGREAGRRRTVITEAEFLARRESVERVMVVRHKEDRTQIGVREVERLAVELGWRDRLLAGHRFGDLWRPGVRVDQPGMVATKAQSQQEVAQRDVVHRPHPTYR